MDNNKKIFTIFDNGIKKEYDVILTFKNERNDKDYIVYTDNKYDEYDKLKIYAAEYDPLTNKYLGYVENQEEWNDIIRLLDKVLIQK